MPNAFARAAAAVAGPRAQWNRRASESGWGSGSTFNAGSLSRLYQDWTPWTFSPNFEVQWASRFVRARARQLIRDNPYVSGLIGSIQENVVGEAGRTFRAKIKLADGKTLATSTNKELERAWKEWGHQENTSANRRESWIDVQNLHIATMAAAGEVLARKLRG